MKVGAAGKRATADAEDAAMASKKVARRRAQASRWWVDVGVDVGMGLGLGLRLQATARMSSGSSNGSPKIPRRERSRAPTKLARDRRPRESPFTMNSEERRRKRSSDPLVALHYQLAKARHEGQLEAIVVADGSGVVVAGSGAWAVCEELAAYAPLLAQGVWSEPGIASASRVAQLRTQVDVQSVEVDGQTVLLCARGPAAPAAPSGGAALSGSGRSSVDQAAPGAARSPQQAARGPGRFARSLPQKTAHRSSTRAFPPRHHGPLPP